VVLEREQGTLAGLAGCFTLMHCGAMAIASRDGQYYYLFDYQFTLS
jgi:hypothetical protein